MLHSRPAAKLALDSDVALSLFYLIEVLMSGGSASATLPCKNRGEKKQKTHTMLRPLSAIQAWVWSDRRLTACAFVLS